MQEFSIIIEENPSDDDCRFVGQRLHEFNVSQTGLEVKPVAVFLRDMEKNIIGGMLGWTFLDCLHINILWVRDDARGKGYGKRLLFAAEREALNRACRHAQLETLSFQAPEFYQKQGYRLLGKIDDVAGKYTWCSWQRI